MMTFLTPKGKGRSSITNTYSDESQAKQNGTHDENVALDKTNLRDPATEENGTDDDILKPETVEWETVSIVSDVFQGTMLSEVSCKRCQHVCNPCLSYVFFEHI